MSFRGLIVLLDEAISAADEKGLRKDWQKDMRGLLGAAVKQNKRAYTKRAAMPPAPKKADATKSPADQMKNAQRGNTGSSGSDVEGPKGGNRSSGFSGSLGNIGFGGGGGGSSSGGMRGGGGGVPANIDIKSTKQPAKDSEVDLLAAAVKKGPHWVQDATELIKLLNANGSKFAKAIVKAIEESSPKGRPTFRKVDYSYVTVEISVEVNRWNGAYEFIVGFELEPGKSAKDIHFHDDNVQVSEVYVTNADGYDNLEEGDIISDEDFIRRVNEPSNTLASYYNQIQLNDDQNLLESMLDTPALQPLYKWVTSGFAFFAAQDDPHGGIAPGGYQIADFEKKKGKVEVSLYISTLESDRRYAIVLTCADNDKSDNAIEIAEIITMGRGKFDNVPTKVLFADLEDDIKKSK